MTIQDILGVVPCGLVNTYRRLEIIQEDSGFLDPRMEDRNFDRVQHYQKKKTWIFISSSARSVT